METIENLNRQLEKDAKKYIWPPFTQMQESAYEQPLIIKRGFGSILEDIYGNQYIDGVSSLWTNVHGHRKKKLDLAIKKQLEMVAHSTLLGLYNIPAIKCAKKLVEITPEGLTRVFFSDNGSTAVEIALKIAFQYHQQADEGNPDKTKFISFANAYHGDTIGSVSVGGIDLFHAAYKHLLFESLKVPSPYCFRCIFEKSYPSCSLECLGRLEELMKARSHQVAALVIEPMVQGAAGILVQPPGYLKRVRELCTRHNIFMIADEVAVGFGKTGKMFACQHEDVIPDIMALAKGISGGYLPLAATLVTEEIYKGFLGKHEEFKTFFHGHTYTGNPLACAVSTASQEIFEEEQVLDKIHVKIDYFRKNLESFKALNHVGDVRQAGFMVGIELVEDKNSKKPFPVKKRIGHQVIMEARKRALIIRPLGDVIVLMPPLSISIDEIDRLCQITYESIRAVTE
ncbi:MAG TPA: adenosylmethionine--8-amino-7-oxononanoate transaminase [Desulfobacteraceae bacterium]|nr:MAG: adenosylmethionine--8-amino-7-oxononanoate transaminase [Candidatus Woesearchaeota archaeon]HDL08387.1 adenosylmethionine--8-amino-7-oxononanoate transaminase [Desulfobacteraceae bacterium]